MKKLAVIFAGISLFAATSCDNKDEPTVYYPIAGTWQPIKETWTDVVPGVDPESDEILYTACQKNGRWFFDGNFSGKREDKTDDPTTPGACVDQPARNFTYMYNGNGDDNFQIKYQGVVAPETGKVTKLTANEMNFKLEYIDNTGYHSKTYTFVRVQ